MALICGLDINGIEKGGPLLPASFVLFLPAIDTDHLTAERTKKNDFKEFTGKQMGMCTFFMNRQVSFGNKY